MFASTRHSRGQRRGVVLIVILAMLGLLALIGVTFATFSNQAKSNARGFMLAQNFPDSSEMMDFALSQLIDDTANPMSAIRGHSLRRDMFGNDAFFNGYLTSLPNGNLLTGTTATATINGVSCLQFTTNIPVGGVFYGYDFTRWIMRVPSAGNLSVAQTLEILGDNTSGGTHVFIVALPDTSTTMRNVSGYSTSGAGPATNASLIMSSFTIGATVPFTLDGRFLRAFNGPGMGPLAVYGNFRVNGGLLSSASSAYTATPTILGNPDAVGMDEDYDACDLENWFLAIQSADGGVIIPSFHRPGIIRADPTDTNYPNNPISSTATNDWRNTNPDSAARFLRPRYADGHNQVSFPDLVPDPTTGRITFDVDNDGDGLTDSVWLDLGYPSKRDSTGLLYKPLFSFLVIGLNGRLPLNTAGDFGPNGGLPVSHLGNMPGEIDMSYALQGAVDTTGYFIANTMSSQVDNAGVPVNLTQLRNLLTGTRPQNDPIVAPPATGALNGDLNVVFVPTGTASSPFYQYWMPNNVPDQYDYSSDGNFIYRKVNPVAGKWGEPNMIPGEQVMPLGPVVAAGGNPGPFSNKVRAGLSYVYFDQTSGTYQYRDGDDDNYTTFDAFPLTGVGGGRSGEVNDEDLVDSAGAFLLPVERTRRNVVPYDATGKGTFNTYNYNGPGSSSNWLGPDQYGRINYFGYFRSPGAPAALSLTVTPLYPTAGITSYTTTTTLTTPVKDNDVAVTPFTAPAQSAVNTTNNLFHGYESHRMPNYAQGPKPSAVGGMPVEIGNGLTVPSYDGTVNTKLGAAEMNEPNEMNLYAQNVYDSAFGPFDLEWLYRYQDSDGSSLTSRLSQLAPISFLNPVDGLRRRRMFSLDVWETTNFAWAPDNPGGVFPNNAAIPAPGDYVDSPPINPANPQVWLTSTQILTNASMLSRSLLPAVSTFYPSPPGNIFATPSLAMRDRKINLNYPLPLSSDPDEPVRKKWVSESYQMLKAVLPPAAVDTPYELAQLSQFLINIIDFRDPDGSITHWVNPDVVIWPVQATTTAGSTTYSPPLLLSNADALTAQTNNPTMQWVPLHQFGMEYNPLAINEVLAYALPYKGTSADDEASRLWVELVNTLSEPWTGTSPPTYPNNIPAPAIPAAGMPPVTASQLDLSNWYMLVLPDDPTGRPDPVTGQPPALPMGLSATGTPMGYNPTFYNSKIIASTTVAPTFALQPGMAVTWNTIGSLGSSYSTATLTGTNPPPPYYLQIPQPQPIASAINTAIIPALASPKYLNPYPPTPASSPDLALTTVGGAARSYYYVLTDAYGVSGGPLGMTPKTTLETGTLPTPNAQLPDGLMQQLMQYTTASGGQTPRYQWLYLLRRANPLDANSQLVAVDSFRFPYAEALSSGGNTTTPTAGTQPIYSVQRLQPYRGGHAVPSIQYLSNNNTGYTTNTTLSTVNAFFPPEAYGYSEQTAPTPASGTGVKTMTGQYGGSNITAPISHTLGFPNVPSDLAWDFFPFHDRDFTSLGELMFVPGCPPGLFTKKFAEFAPPLTAVPTYDTSGNPTNNRQGYPPLVTGTQPSPASPFLVDMLNSIPIPVPHTYPYLVDNFFYTAQREMQNATNSPAEIPINTGATLTSPYVGGPSSAGWYKMFEFFEVPSPVIGAIGPVAQGTNFDWYRQDTKPGLLNLNLIIDEEVFLGLIGDSNPTGPNSPPGDYQLLNTNPPLQTTTTNPPQPAIVTMTTPTNGVAAHYNMSNVGYYDPKNVGVINGVTFVGNEMKGAFSDFLKLRHGGSGFLFGYGGGAVGQIAPLASERPYRSLSFPDINYTVMRPATLPPSDYSSTGGATPLPGTRPPWVQASLWTPTYTGPTPPVWDPGLKPPFLTMGYARYQMPLAPGATGTHVASPYEVAVGTLPPPMYPPPIPTRRLFQLPDNYAGNTTTTPPIAPSNASLTGDYVNVNTPTIFAASSIPTTFSAQTAISNTSLFFDNPMATGPGDTSGNTNNFLGGYPLAKNFVSPNTTVATSYTAAPDMRQHPYFRYDWMQKLLSLSTVRTHQFAVWITVGFFEVTRQGDPQLSAANPALAYDILGQEMNLTSGRNIRYRSFFLVDRLQSVGFNPYTPGDFRTAVVYRQSIE